MTSKRKSPVIISYQEPETTKRQTLWLPKGDEELVFDEYGQTTFFSSYGAGWVDGIFVDSAASLKRFFSKPKKDMLRTIFDSHKGSLSLYIRTSDDTTYIIPDPLSSSLVYFYEDEHVSAFSSELGALLQALSIFKITPEKNFDYLTELISTGNGGFIPSSYKNIKTLDPFSYVELKKNTIKIKDSPIKNIFFQPLSPKDKENLFEEIRAEFVQNALAVYNSNRKNKVAHLTGGFDSRLVLASLMHSKVDLDQINFMCSGNDETNDKIIAKKLCAHFGLTFSNSDGRSSEQMHAPGKSLFSTNGIVRLDLPEKFLPDYVVMSGGYGGLLRSVYGMRTTRANLYNTPELLQELFGSKFTNTNDSIISSRFHSEYSELFSSYLNKAIENGISPDAVLDYIFATKRNRYYIGTISAIFSGYSPRVDPLYSVGALRLALNLSPSDRKSNFLGLNLLRSFNEDLISLPFDTAKIDANYIKENRPVKNLDFQKRELKTNLVESSRQTKTSKKPTREQILLAQKMNSSLMQIVYLDDVQKNGVSVLRKNKSIVEQNLNWQVVNRYFNSSLKNRVHIRTAFSIYDALNWYAN